MEFALGLSAVIFAGVLQGTYFLPMFFTKKWEWEHNWFVFSLFAMLVFNWILALILINDLGKILTLLPADTSLIVLLSGTVWGIGTILFGKAMNKMGMALGYPVIMGVSTLGGMVIPAVIFSPEVFLSLKGLIIVAGVIIAVIGIRFCAIASANKSGYKESDRKVSGKWIFIGIIAGFTGCLPNVGAAFSYAIRDIAIEMGNKDYLANNFVWCLFLTMGFIINATYTIFLISKGKSCGRLFTHSRLNWLWIMGMSAMWTGSLYIYGMGSSMLGNSGLIIGWPLLVILSILIGNLWGIYRGEWAAATARSRRMLNTGLTVLLVAVVILSLSNLNI